MSPDRAARMQQDRVGGEPEGRICEACAKPDTSGDPVDKALYNVSVPLSWGVVSLGAGRDGKQ
eukprot:9147987-Prorocentrum_lima.AAC.1